MTLLILSIIPSCFRTRKYVLKSFYWHTKNFPSLYFRLLLYKILFILLNYSTHLLGHVTQFSADKIMFIYFFINNTFQMFLTTGCIYTWAFLFSCGLATLLYFYPNLVTTAASLLATFYSFQRTIHYGCYCNLAVFLYCPFCEEGSIIGLWHCCVYVS